jgi:hypothetical protein
MNRKKVTIVYVYLALFAFTLGFSFAARVNAEHGPEVEPCCVMEWCPGDPDQPGRTGHWVMGQQGYVVCVSTDHLCDIWLMCYDLNP